MELLREIAFSKRIQEKEAKSLKVGDVVSDRGRITEIVDRGHLLVLKFYGGDKGAISKKSNVEVII